MRIFGTICEAGNGRAIASLIVRAYHRDLLFDEALGFATTRSDGSFEIRPNQRQAPPERNSDLFLRVLDPTGEHEIFDTLGSARQNSGADDELELEFEIAIPPENLGPRFERRDRSADTAREFFQALAALTPRIVVTPALLFLNFAVFAALVVSGASPLSPDVATLLDWGANSGVRTLAGEWWRLVACIFLHGGIIHLSLNCYVLWIAGRVVERLVGATSFATLYIVSGVIGSLASLAWNPFSVSVGASGAIFGVWGALLGYAIRQRDPATLRGLEQLRNIALLFVLANILAGMTLEHIDLAAHIGGLIAGIASGLLLSQPVSLRARERRGPRLAILCAASLVVIVTLAAALPRKVIAVDAELKRFDRAQIALTDRFNRAFSGEEGKLSISEMRALLENEILPAWNEARTRVEKLEGLPPIIQANVEAALVRARKWEAEWHTLAGDFGRFQDAFTELENLENLAAEKYQRAFAEVQAGSLSHDGFAAVLKAEVLPEWQFERKIDGLKSLREPLQTLAITLSQYAEIRQQAWQLYVEAVRTHDEELARAAAQEHLRADAMIASWAGVELKPETPASP